MAFGIKSDVDGVEVIHTRPCYRALFGIRAESQRSSKYTVNFPLPELHGGKLLIVHGQGMAPVKYNFTSPSGYANCFNNWWISNGRVYLEFTTGNFGGGSMVHHFTAFVDRR